MARLSESPDDPPPSSATARLPEPSFSVEVFTVDTDAPVVVAHGEVDMATASQLSEVVGQVLERSPGGLVLDLSDVGFMGSAAVKVIAHARRSLSAERPVVPRRPQRQVREVLRITHMDNLCLIED